MQDTGGQDTGEDTGVQKAGVQHTGQAKQTLPRYRRIGRREKFDLSPGADVSSNGWFVVYARKNRIGVSRLGVAVSKRVAPDATSRNLAKRLVRECFRRVFPAGCALNVIVRVRKPLDRKTAREGTEALARLLRGVQAKCGN